MSARLRLVVVAVVSTAILLFGGALYFVPFAVAIASPGAVAFWVCLALLSSAFPVQMPRGTIVSVSTAPVLAAIALGGPAAGALVAALGTLEWREVRIRIPLYGTLYNHASAIVPAVLAGFVYVVLAGSSFHPTVQTFVAVVVAGGVYLFANTSLTAMAIAAREEKRTAAVLLADLRAFGPSLAALAPLAWLMAVVWTVDWWAVLLFALPLLAHRQGHALFVEIRQMFTQTVASLASAVDAKDHFTAGHSERVQLIARDIGAEMRCSEAELEALEWGGLLHDIGKIGVPDAVLLKQDRLTREERMVMNTHPVKGEEILKPVKKLAPELPLIRHHHEWYNGSGYPDHLAGEEIPKLARILHVADAFEAMTAARPYRMTPLSTDQAIAELRKFTGIQFDPVAVAAFERTRWAKGWRVPIRVEQARPIPLLGQAAAMRAHAVRTGTHNAET